ncbi:hypothetical protein F4679DRAFT_537122 [Xylaria curta]|nr:hypothetical protein F4679DRAFT_537122 [Xylaria curta]
MTSSNAAPTDEGRAAAANATGSPPPAAATPPSSRPSAPADRDASAATLTAPDAPNAEPEPVPDAPATASPPPPGPTHETEAAVDPQPSTADLSNQMAPEQDSNETGTDLPIPSPPTVSPLSTPAATHVNLDDNLTDDAVARLTADLPPLSLARDSPIFRSGMFGPPQPANSKPLSVPDGMELDEPFMPDASPYQRRSQVQAIATTDPDPHAADYSSHGILAGMRLSQGSIDPSAYIMNLAAQATLFHDNGPSSIHPSAVSLHSFTQDSDAVTGSAEPTSTNESQQLESFARIEFADSTFQMTTYAVIIGRDKAAMEQARADERREAAYRRKCEENERNGLPPPTPVMYDRGKFSKSYVSEEGGMLGPEHSDGEDVKPAKRRRPSSAAQAAADEENTSGNHVQSNRQYVSHTPGAAAVDLGALQPSPGHIPFIGIHSPGPDIASKTRGISRQHLKIQFNKKRGVFEGIALHKNGFFCEDVLYGLNQPATLRSGDRLQIKDVEFYFVINGVQTGMTGGEDEDVASSKRMSVGGKEMSLDFEHSDHENFRDTSEELSDVENNPTPAIEERGEKAPESVPHPAPAPAPVPAPVPPPVSVSAGIAESGPEPESELEPEATRAQSVARDEFISPEIIKHELDMLGELPPDYALPEIPRRRGPGRPPKDGIMSKRERRMLKKQLQETSKKTLPQESQEEKIKRPVGRPRKNPLPEDGERPEKRKYNKKQRPDGEEGSDIEKRVKEKKDKKVRPKSPPLDLRIEDYTHEQLQKPTKNYGVLIDEALTNGPPDGLTLKQIYKRITARYPWFFFSAETKGWESSVRHNLIGNEAFKKDEETGLWSRVPGVELDAGKKRKASSPDRHLGPSHLHSHLSHPPYYQNSPYANPGSVSYAHGLPNYSTEQKHSQPTYANTGQSTQVQTTTSQPSTQPVYAPHVPAPAQLPPGYGSLAAPRPSNTPQQSTYSSPYARPPPPSNPPAKVETNLANSQGPTAPSTSQSITPAPQSTTPQIRPSISNAGPREQLSPDIERAIVQFSANMLNVISKQTPHAAAIIEAAANRVRGLPVQNRVPGFDSVETTLINAMQGMIKDMKQKHQHTVTASPAPSAPAQTSSTPSPAPPNTAEAEIQRRLRNFRESMVSALKTKTDKAEIIVDSAINRARGLPHAGKIPGWEEADNLMVKSVTQIIAEARSAHSLQLQKASPTPANTSRASVSQPPQSQSALRTEPSTSLAPARAPITSTGLHVPPKTSTSATPNTPNTHPAAPSVTNSNPLSGARPNIPLQRPSPVALSRPPTMGPIARPATFQRESAAASAMPSATAPAMPRPNVSSPAPPSAGVLDQITGHKRFTDEAFHKTHGVNGGIGTTSSIGSNTGPLGNVAKTLSSTASSSSIVKTISPGAAASSTANGAASNVTGNTTSEATSNATSNTASNRASNIAANPTNTTSTNNPTSSVTTNTASNPSNIMSSKMMSNPMSSRATNTANNSTSSTPNIVASVPTSSIASNGGSHSTSSAPANTPSYPTSSSASTISSGIMTNQTGTVPRTSNAGLTKNDAAGNGGTPKVTTGHTASISASNPSSNITSKITPTDIPNYATTVTKTGTTGGTPGVNALEPHRGEVTSTARSMAAGAIANHATSGYLGNTSSAQNSNNSGESANNKIGNEMSIASKVSAMENHEPKASKAPTLIHNMSSPAPPSAGVVDQIAGHKRTLDEGPGSANAEQPEPKRLGVSPV